MVNIHGLFIATIINLHWQCLMLGYAWVPAPPDPRPASCPLLLPTMTDRFHMQTTTKIHPTLKMDSRMTIIPACFHDSCGQPGGEKQQLALPTPIDHGSFMFQIPWRAQPSLLTHCAKERRENEDLQLFSWW